PKQAQHRLVQDAVCFMEIAQTWEILTKHLAGQKTQTFVGQRQQLRARSAISLAHAIEQLLKLVDSLVRHALLSRREAHIHMYSLMTIIECTAKNSFRPVRARLECGGSTPLWMFGCVDSSRGPIQSDVEPPHSKGKLQIPV